MPTEPIIPQKPRHISLRLHRSTKVVVVLNVLLLLLLNIPGYFVLAPEITGDGHYGAGFFVGTFCEHGWPISFLHRRNIGGWYQNERLSRWELWAGIRTFSAGKLIADIVMGIALAVGGAALFEGWRRRRLRLFHLHLADLFVITAIVATFSGAFAYRRSRHAEDERIMQAIASTKLRNVEWAISVKDRIIWQHDAPSWLRPYIGDKAFQIFDRAIEIDAAGEELEHAVKLVDLKKVGITGSVSNRQLELLERLPKLQALNLDSAGLNAEGIDEHGITIQQYFRLPMLPNLRGLNLYNTSFQGDGLENIPAIEVLHLSDTDVTDEAILKVRSFRSLKHLSIIDTKITNEGLRYLASLPALESLSIGGEGIDDQGLWQLTTSLGLRTLLVVDNDVTDAAVPALKCLTMLESLYLRDTSITENGLDELRKALPNCDIP